MFKNPYLGPLLRAILLQACCLFFFALLLDEGRHFTACAYVSFGFWLGAFLIWARRPRSPTRGDLLYFRWGLLLVVVIGVTLMTWVWQLKGV
jgi:hypothetical protein